jgi:hypothetical protein
MSLRFSSEKFIISPNKGKVNNRHLVAGFALLAFLVFSFISGRSQSGAVIDNVDFNQKSDSLFVTYDLLKAKRNERFTVFLKIIPKSGREIKPVSVSGDIGNDIQGGKGKLMIWNIRKDNIEINEEIAVEVTAISQMADIKQFSRGKALLLSAVVPGLGITKLKNGGAWWLMSLGVYGCLAGSWVYHEMAQDNYGKYDQSLITDERNSLYSTANQQHDISVGFLYASGAIWLGNVIWTLATPKKTGDDLKGLSVSGGYDPISQTPMVNIKFGF